MFNFMVMEWLFITGTSVCISTIGTLYDKEHRDLTWFTKNVLVTSTVRVEEILLILRSTDNRMRLGCDIVYIVFSIQKSKTKNPSLYSTLYTNATRLLLSAAERSLIDSRHIF